MGTVELMEVLIKASFPPDEQEPIESLLALAEKPMVNFWAYYVGEKFCLISAADNYDISTYMNLMYAYSGGEYTPPVYKESER